MNEKHGDGGGSPKNFHDRHGGVAVVLATGSEGEGAHAVAGRETDDFSDKVTDSDTCDDEGKSKSYTGGKSGKITKDDSSEHAIENETRSHHPKDDAQDPCVETRPENPNPAQHRTADDE